MAKLSENSAKILAYVQAHDGEDFTAQDIADALEMNVKSVNGSITRGLQMKGLTVREEAVVETGDGTKKVKFIRATEAGKTFDPENDEA